MLEQRMDWTVTPQAQTAILALGRTEDVHWSPDGRQIAIAAFVRNEILVLAVERTPALELSAPRWLACAQFQAPHGVFWMDDRHLIVASRRGGVSVVEVPRASLADERFELEPLAAIAPGSMSVKTPGSVCALPLGGGLYEMLVCNNYVNYVSAHLVDTHQRCSIRGGSVLLAAGLGVPDGVAVSPDRGWIAVSNHDHHCVFVYRNTADLTPAAIPDAVLEGLVYPHGLRFTPHGDALLVADAGRPEVHWFERGTHDWHGRRSAEKVFRVLDDDDFKRGQHNPQEGGPKGVALSPDGAVLAVTCEQRALDFFDVGAGASALHAESATAAGAADADQLRSLLLRELPRAWEAMDRLQSIEKSRAWRWTHWLHRLEPALKGRWRRLRRARRKASAG